MIRKQYIYLYQQKKRELGKTADGPEQLRKQLTKLKQPGISWKKTEKETGL